MRINPENDGHSHETGEKHDEGCGDEAHFPPPKKICDAWLYKASFTLRM